MSMWNRDGSRKPVVDCSVVPGRTKQSFKKDCDVNVIMRKYAKTGVMDPAVLEKRKGVYGDFTGIEDFMECQSKVLRAREVFSHLDAGVRSRFGHNVGNLIQWLNAPENMNEALKLGFFGVEPGSTPKGDQAKPGEPDGGTSPAKPVVVEPSKEGA